MNQKTQIRFNNQLDKNAFYATLKRRVDSYFKENNISKYANTEMVVKSIAMISMYILPFVALLYFQPSFGTSLLLWSVMGFGLSGIGMAVMHDANHGAYSPNPLINKLMGHTLNIAGGAVLNWKLQHNVLHHTYTNVTHVDDDISDRLVLKFSPHTKVKPFHQFQFVYAFFFYGLLTLYWVLAKDFIQYLKFSKEGVNKNTKKQNVVFLFNLIINKALYFFIILGVPTLFFDIPFVQSVAGFVLMHFIAGLVMTVIFQLAHSVEGTTHPLPNANGTIENDWAIHQMQTTVNFAPNNWLLNWYVGGLNYQVEHHLFTTICHIHYPKIAPIVKATAEEFGVPYMVKDKFSSALQGHVSFLQRVGKLPDLNEALG
jgi:linoleoyl-CoA desaturase